jgi:peroxiredoxin
MKYSVLIFVVLLIFSDSFAQGIVIKVADSNGKAALFSLSGEKTFFVDSIAAVNNSYNFNLSNNHPGFYRLVFGNKKSIDFINDNEDIEIEYTSADNDKNINIIKSESNKLYSDFVKLNKDYKTKTDLLYLIIASYPKEDDYYNTSVAKLKSIQKDYLNFVNITAQSKPKSFIAQYIKSAQLPVVKAEIPVAEHIKYLKTHALDNVDFSNDDLIYSDVFTNKTIEYLSYYSNPGLPKQLLEKEFESAVDSVLNKAKVNEIVYKQITEYLLDGFKQYGFDDVLNYILDNYVIKDDICLDEKLSTALERRIDQSRYFKPGTEVPPIKLNDINGSPFDLRNVNADEILIVFYASWCPHCQEMLPQIYELYKEQKEKKLEVVAVSIDTLKTSWQNFVNNNTPDWINVSDLKGWNGQATNDYYIYATPTMFLVDKQGVLIKIIKDIDEFKKYL